MKFMQRAAASQSAASSPETTPSSKKRKIDHSSPSGRIDLNISEAAIKAALDDQEATRQAALRKHTVGDTQWVLQGSIDKLKPAAAANPPMNIVYVGYGDVDSADESGDEGDLPSRGRTSTKDYNKTPKKAGQKSTSDDEEEDEDEDDSNEDSDEGDDSTPIKKRNRGGDGQQSSSAKRSRSRSQPRVPGEAQRAKEFRDKRRKEIPLSKLTSISSAGGSPLASQSAKGMKCYNCQKVGHRASDCPKRK
jgi:hypothetical protein